MYKITNANDSNVEIFYSVFEYLEDGTTRGWGLNEFYRNGSAYRTEDRTLISSANVICDLDVGQTILGNFVCAHFEFNEEYDQIEQGVIRNDWSKLGSAMLNDSRWFIEESYIRFPSATIQSIHDTIESLTVEYGE